MLTNNIKVNYNFKNINADFDIFRVVKESKDYYKHNILDSAVYEFKATAVQWAFGAVALVLFRKGMVTEQEFKDSIMKEYKDVTIQKIDVLDNKQCADYFYYENRLLAQLLINSMRTPSCEEFMYNNLTGKLFYHDPTWKSRDKKTGEITFIRFLEIVIDPGMYLNLELKTFKRSDYEKSGRLYVIDPKTGEFRKKLKTDKNMNTYIEGSLPHNHFTVDNFNITDYTKFRKSKLGIMEQFLRDVKEKLSEYISIEICEREDVQTFNISNLERASISEKEYGSLLRKRGVVIVDENETEKSKEVMKLLKHELKEYYGVEALIGDLSKASYNIRIIHSEEYYTEHEIADPHNDNLKGYIVQHMTEEAEHFIENEGCSPAIKKIIQELIIKGDVRNRSISIYDWEKLDSGKEWSFVIRKKVKTKQGERVEHLNFAKQKNYNYFNYYRLKIDLNGKMEFDSFCDADEVKSEEWRKICTTYDTMHGKKFGSKNEVEGLVYSDIDNIQVIVLTREKTLPNITALMDTLKETDVKEKVPTELLLRGIADFGTVYPQYQEHVSEWNIKFSDASEMITKKELKKILNMRTNAASALNRFLHDKYNLWIDGELRKKEFEVTYQFSSLMNIKFQYNEFDDVDGSSFTYYVGSKNKRLSYPNACCIRKVVTLGETLEYEELLPLMAVEFVRNSQYTVLPFPYKYLREYVAQC